MHPLPRWSGVELSRARAIVRQVCKLAGQATCVDDLRHEAIETGLAAAVTSHNSPAVFDWLMAMLSYQGISDTVADGYIGRHGNVTWTDLKNSLAADGDCPKLQGYWAFSACHYQKTTQTCAEPDRFAACAVPRHLLRNGRLNQTAYSLYLFIRDVAKGDIIGWVDRQIGPAVAAGDFAAARLALLDPLRHVSGVSDKVIAMALATLLMGAGADRPGWFEIGAGFVVVDTLVHNFLARTGILDRLSAFHPYGPACYRPDGCAGVLQAVAAGIDARRFNPAFPQAFPRFVQHAIWRYCAQGCLDVCNGNRIDDRRGCTNMWCQLYGRCDRRVLHGDAKKKRPKAADL